MHEEFFQLLRNDHELFEDLLHQLRQTPGGEPKKRRELFSKFRLEIQSHTKAEERIFYPPLAENKAAQDDVLESIEEHHVIELLLNELDQLSVQKDQWGAKLRVCKELVEHHIAEEENKIFEDARRSLSEERMRGVLRGFQEEKGRLRRSMGANM